MIARPVRLIVLSSLFVATTAFAQWAWRDSNGQMVFSDQAPPASVKAEQIVRRPNLPSGATSKPATTDSKATPSAIGAKPASAGRDPGESGARESESQDSAQRAIKEQRAQDCERMRRYVLALESGQRVALPDAQGNPVVMDDAARTTEIATMRKRLAGC